MTILITGANGQLGSEIRELVQLNDVAESNTYHFTDVQELDITNRDAVRSFVRENGVQLLINCAAYTAVDRAESDVELCHRLNAEAPGILAEAMEDVEGAIIHISTDYVFDGSAYTPYREDCPTNPQTEYGRTKLLGEQNVLSACRRSLIIRTAWLYSAYGSNFVKTMLRLGRERDQLGVIFDQIGTPTYARDLAKTILHIANAGIIPGIYHFSNEGVTSWYDFTLAIHRIAGIEDCKVRPLHTEEYPTPAARPHYSVLDKTKIKASYKIEIPWWEKSLADCIRRLAEKSNC